MATPSFFGAGHAAGTGLAHAANRTESFRAGFGVGWNNTRTGRTFRNPASQQQMERVVGPRRKPKQDGDEAAPEQKQPAAQQERRGSDRLAGPGIERPTDGPLSATNMGMHRGTFNAAVAEISQPAVAGPGPANRGPSAARQPAFNVTGGSLVGEPGAEYTTGKVVNHWSERGPGPSPLPLGAFSGSSSARAAAWRLPQGSTPYPYSAATAGSTFRPPGSFA